MPIGHDILITVDRKIKPYIYPLLIDYIGKNYSKKYPGESTFKNGIRVICQNCSTSISKKQVKKWAQTRFYFGKPTIIMDIKISEEIFDALLKSLYNIPGKKECIDNLLLSHFNNIKKGTEQYSIRLTILEDIYRILLVNGNVNNTSSTLCYTLKNIENIFSGE